MTRTEARRLAKRIAGKLFMSALGGKATRLMLVSESNTGHAFLRRDLGGWVEKYAIDAITDVLAPPRRTRR